MDSTDRIVTTMPLEELWDSNGRVDARRGDHIGEADIERLLQSGASLVVANMIKPLRWITGDDRFAFWNTEVKCRLAPGDGEPFDLDDFPGSYCYGATMWTSASSAPVIVLEVFH